MANNAQYVTAASPKVGGAISRAPFGTALPTDATTALNAAFKNLGYMSEDGVTDGTSIESASTKAWGRDTVLAEQTGKTKTLKFKMIQALDEEVLKMRYGDSNVTGDLSTGRTIKENSEADTDHSYVVETILRNNVLERMVIPSAKITDISDVVYKDGTPIGYEVTLTLTPDTNGNTIYKYQKG